MSRFAFLFALLSAVFVSAAYAAIDYGKEILKLGVQATLSGDQVYFTVVDGFSYACPTQHVYFPLSSNFGKAAYAQLLAAKASGKKLSRIDYSQNSVNEPCTLTLIEVEQ